MDPTLTTKITKTTSATKRTKTIFTTKVTKNAKAGERERMRLLVLITIVSAYSSAARAQLPDACRARIPASVAKAVTRHFPEYRLPLASDGDPDVVEFERLKGKSGCIVVAEGDFNGDKKKDFAIGLTPTTTKEPLVAVALSHGTTWDISTVKSWVDAVQRLYVRRSGPGRFKRFEGFDSPIERGTNERESLLCRTDALIVGATESTGIAYCYMNNTWLYVWISD